MERILKITIDLLRGATYDYETKFTQADSQSHYLQIDFSDTSLNFSGVSMKVNFIRSDGVAVTTSKASVTSSNKVQIPTNALAKFGELGIEIILIKGDSILTVNKLIRVTVIKTLAGEGIDLEIGDSFLNEINQLTVNLSKVLTGEGDKQIERVRATGNEVVKQVESILGNNPEGGNAAAVGGLSRAGIETLIDNVVGKVEDGKFPLTSAEVGKVYEAVNGKKYKCIKAYSGSSLSTPNANFIEMSLNNHADRLDNLYTFGVEKYVYNLNHLQSIILGQGLYMAFNPHWGIHTMASIQIFNLSGYDKLEEYNQFYKAECILPSSGNPTFPLEYNPYTCEVRLNAPNIENATKSFCFYRLNSHNNGSDYKF